MHTHTNTQTYTHAHTATHGKPHESLEAKSPSQRLHSRIEQDNLWGGGGGEGGGGEAAREGGGEGEIGRRGVDVASAYQNSDLNLSEAARAAMGIRCVCM